MIRTSILVAATLVATAACHKPAPAHRPLPPAPKPGAITLTIVGTNDLHGALERLPILAGYVANLRAARAADHGGVVLVDGGDLFQGTLASNLAEGADVVAAYNQMGYAASAIGNHEFDYGPVGPAVIAKSIEEDPRGALKARASEAKFPFLATNIFDAQAHARIQWPNMVASTLVDAGGIAVGIIGASTEATPHTTMPANFAGLEIAKPAQLIVEQAAALRARGAKVIVVAAHIGSACKDLAHPNDSSSCDHKEELFDLIGNLPHGTVDVIVAGHTHAAIAHRIDDIAVIESYSSGRAFGRVDLRISPDGHVTAAKVFPPQDLCPAPTPDASTERAPIPIEQCRPAPYEGAPVIADAAVQTIVDGAVAKADARRKEKLGPVLRAPIQRAHGTESAEGNWFCDLMLAAQPKADVALTNGGGLRADVPAGELTYGGLFEAMPFDNRFALVTLKGSQLRRLVTTNLQRNGAIFSWGGLTAKARCAGDKLDVQIKVKGKALADQATYTLVTSDFLASGGDGVIGRLKLPEGAITLTDIIIRETMADLLRKQAGATIDPATLLAPNRRRLDYEGERPVLCGSTKGGKNRGTEEPPE